MRSVQPALSGCKSLYPLFESFCERLGPGLSVFFPPPVLACSLFFHAPSAAFQTHLVEQGLSPHLVEDVDYVIVIAAALITFFTQGKIADALRISTGARASLVLQDQGRKKRTIGLLWCRWPPARLTNSGLL